MTDSLAKKYSAQTGSGIEFLLVELGKKFFLDRERAYTDGRVDAFTRVVEIIQNRTLEFQGDPHTAWSTIRADLKVELEK